MRSRLLFLLAVLLSLPTAVLGRVPPTAVRPPPVQQTVAAPRHKSQPAHKHHAVVAKRRPLRVPLKDDSATHAAAPESAPPPDEQLFRKFVEWQNENGKHAGE